MTTAQSTKLSSTSSENIPFNPDVKTGTLSNGLTYYIKNNPKPENKLELRLVVKIGSILEDEDQLGLAHFMEHMCFNGTKNFKKNELVDYLQSIGVKFGAHLNAYTSFDETVYMLSIPSEDPEKLEKGFQVIEDWAHNVLLTDEEIDKERGVVLEEHRLGQGANERMMQKYLPKVLYGSKYAKRLPIGKKKIIESFDYETIRRFYKDWYRPDLMSVIAIGDVDVNTLEEKIKSHFRHITNPETSRPRETFYLENHKETLITIESDKEAAFSSVQVIFKDLENSKANVTIDEYKHQMAESLFSQMINNRLDELRNGENPPFVYGYSYHGGTWAKTKEAYQSIAMSSETGQLKALETLLEENERVRQFGFKSSELERSKKNILARLEKAYNDKDKTESNRIIGEFIRHFLTNEPVPGIAWEYNFHKEHLGDINLEDVNSLIANYIREDNRVIVITGPEKEGLEKVTEAQVLELLNTVNDKDLKPYEDEVLPESLITNKPTLGSITNTSKDEALGTTTLTLSNGATVTYKKTDFKNDEIVFDGYSHGGASLYSDKDYLAVYHANRSLRDAGVNNFDKTTLDKMLSGKIVNVRPSIFGYSQDISGSASPKDFEELFQLTYLYFTALNKNEKTFNSYINKQKAIYGNLLANPQYYFYTEMNKFLSGKDPRFIGHPSNEALDNTDYNLAYQKYKERFADASGFKFYFVGNIDENKLIEYSKQYLASLPATNSNETFKVPDFRPLSGSHEKIIKKGKDPKSSVRILYQGETEYDSKEAYALKSLGEILTIKLIEKLREEEGGVYGVGAKGKIDKLPYTWYEFNISFPCGPENVDKLKAAALAEVEEIIKNGPTDKDLAKIKEAQLLDRKKHLKENGFWLAHLKQSDYYNRNPLYVFDFEKNLKNLSKKDIQKVAKKYLTKGAIIGIHNPED